MTVSDTLHAVNTPLDTLREALEQFANEKDDVREQGFTTLVERSRPFLEHKLLSRQLSIQDRQDLIQEIFRRIWLRRDRLQFVSVGGWWRYLRTMTSNCIVDLVRSKDPSESIEDIEATEIPDREIEDLDDLLEAVEDRRKLYRLADEEFLEVP